MSKFLRQSCSYEACQRDKQGNIVLNDYGEIQYKPTRIVRCRHENSMKTVQTGEGSILRSTSVYYLDDTVNVCAEDRIDGKVVIDVVDYINALGQREGCEVFV